jgi:hypothetical protein
VGACSLWPKNYLLSFEPFTGLLLLFCNSYCHVQKNCLENRDERKNFKNEENTKLT